MKLNHINLPVADVVETRDFLSKYFGLSTVHEVGKNFLVMQRDDTGLLLNLSHFDKNTTSVEYNKDFHIGFFVETREEVDHVYSLLSEDGKANEPPEPKEARYGFYVMAPGGFTIEVAVMEWQKRSEI